MSLRTRGTRVALTAITGICFGRKARTMAIDPYFLRNESPQWEMQCASSIKMERTREEKAGLRSTSSIKRHACRQTARDVAKTGLFVTVYDNINMMFQVAEQILGRKNAQENGTCATIFPLFRAAEEDMSAEAYQHSLMNAPPLTLDDILLTSSEQALHEASMRHTLLRVIVEHGGIGFEKWKPRLQETLPKSKSKIQPLKGADGRPLPITTPIHPLPAMEIDESSIVGNVDVINTIDKELRLNQKGVNYLKFVRIMGGDQLTIAHQRLVLNVRAGHESGFHAWQHVVLMPGLFHAKIADCHGILETHFGLPNAGQQSPGSLCFHNTVMDRLPVVLSSLPTFRVVRDLITVSLYAHILHCLLRVSGKATIEEYTSSVTSWATIEEHANQIYQKFVNADVVTKLRDQCAAEEQVQARAIRKKKRPEGEAPKEYEHIAKGDMVFENGVLFIRDALLTREFADAVKAGDSGRVVIILKLWALAYRGSGRSKYAHEMLHVIYNIRHLWPPGLIRKIILNNWLINPSGKDNAFIEIDLLQEHLNFWIKKIYKADGHAHSWDWLAMISPCIDVLRQLARKINGTLGSRQGAKHSIPNLALDIERLMASLKTHEVYIQKNGRVLFPAEKPAADVISKGLAMLTHGSPTTPLADFNTYYSGLR
ncbi:hypothetical protein PLEOSDRAFT_1034860 [Pleurotus ostreatus PC15]|uniref:DUF6589 domain-containing protein n=1 Tax=Pleurotus ostreatus (strain PC15) TaxID=1137138 RepID=A0A067NW16_PLEO1|nr:hypothetical protein PLEOSDRAFT_1034860 [Pleurotus ostreatus PC15]